MSEGSDLLAALRAVDRERIESRLQVGHYEAGQTLYEPGQSVDYCYFPMGGAIGSYFIQLDSGVVVETLMIGREGALGGVVSHGALPSYARANVMHRGNFGRISLGELERIKQDIPAIDRLFARYADCMMAQVFQSIACNAIHTIEHRAAKWLCAAVERTGQHDITMTQEQLASMMGIGRSYASRVVQRFKGDKLVRTRRGGIEVLDRERLLERACSCNEQVKRHFDVVLAGVYPR